MDIEDFNSAMIDFCEENWHAFVARCEEAGFTESEVEEALDNARVLLYEPRPQITMT